MSPIEISLVIFACVFGGAVAGMWLRTVLPEHHLNAESKSVVTLSVGLIGTMAALVLGLLVASAKSSYDTHSSELTQMAANVIMLDRVLAHYGNETTEIRGLLKAAVTRTIAQIWSKEGIERVVFAAPVNREILFDKIEELAPHNDAQRLFQSQAESMAISLGQTRWLLFEQTGTSIATPFLVVMVFWLGVLFLSFGLFAPFNATTLITLLVSAMSVAAAIFLILELDHPFSGLIQISDAPLRNALALIGK
jgi:hypothetical protein